MRHGESLANVGASNDPDSVLTERGQWQAEAVGEWLATPARGCVPFSHALISPFRRTLMTFQPLQRLTKVPAEVFPAVCEYFHKSDPWSHEFIGLTDQEIRQDFPEIDTAAVLKSPNWWPNPPEDREAVSARAARVAAELGEKWGASHDRILIFSHAETTGRLVEALMGWTPSEFVPWTDNTGVWRVRTNGDVQTAELLLSNSTEHLVAQGIGYAGAL